MIACRNLTKSYRGITVVNSLSLEIHAGICALLGGNGAGKSTLLKLFAGLASPDSGGIRIANIDIASRPVEVRKLIGVLPEELGLFEDLTIQEHLELTGPIYGLSATEGLHRTQSLLSLLRLDHASRTILRNCSFGMRKKTALAMALLHNPQVLLLDEPFEGIDPSSSIVIEQVLRSLATRGATILLTSHILPLVERLASRILILHGGALRWDSANTSVPEAPLSETYFGVVGQPHIEELSWLAS